MDNVAHGLVGAHVANLFFRDRIPAKTALWTGAVAANIPDIDFVIALYDQTTYIYWHRGITHSFLALLVLPVLLAAVVRRISPGCRFRDLWLLCLICQVTHLALDLFTVWGIMMCRPFDDTRMKIPWIFILDLFYWVILAVPFWLQRRKNWAPKRASIWGLSGLVLYYGVCGLNHHLAVEHTRRVAEARGLEVTNVDAFPRPLLPTLWSGVAASDDVVIQVEINNLSSSPTSDVKKFARNLDHPLVKAALETEVGGRYPWFAPMMMAHVVEDEKSRAVIFYNPRFYFPTHWPGGWTARFSLTLPITSGEGAEAEFGAHLWDEGTWPPTLSE